MKNLFSLIILLFISLSSKAQQIVPVEQHPIYLKNGTGIPEGAYIKDVNDVLNPFVGTWIGQHKGKTFELHINKSLRIEEDYRQDLLLIRYKILDSSGLAFADTTSLPDDDPLVIEGLYFHQNGYSYMLDYIGNDYVCGEGGDMFITLSNNGNQLTVLFVAGSGLINSTDCPQGAADWDFPLEEHLVFTKQ